MPHFLSSLLHHLAGCISPGPPADMDSPIPEILNKPQYIEVIAKSILVGSVAHPPDVHRHYRIRRIAITRSNCVQKVYHQTLVLEVEELRDNTRPTLHILVAERCTIPSDYPDKIQATTLPVTKPHNAGEPSELPSQGTPSSLSSEGTKSYFHIPFGDGRDSLRWLQSFKVPADEFWANTKGNPASRFVAKSGVVFDFPSSQSLESDVRSVTLYEAILAMKAVSLVAPRYQFVSTNCWWWAQSVLLLLLRLRHTEDLSLQKVQENNQFFERVKNPKVVMQYPQYLHVNIMLNEGLIMDDTTKALDQYRALEIRAAKAMEEHLARVRLASERDEAEARAKAEASRADIASARADATARQLEAAQAEIARLNALHFAPTSAAQSTSLDT